MNGSVLMAASKDNRMPIRVKLKAIMEERKLSRMDIVRGADISYPTVVRWEEDSISRLDPMTIAKLKKFLQVDDSELYEIYEVEDES